MTVAVQLIHREDLERRQRAGAHRVTAQLEKLWTEYESDERRARSLFLTRFNKIAIQGTPQMAVD